MNNKTSIGSQPPAPPPKPPPPPPLPISAGEAPPALADSPAENRSDSTQRSNSAREAARQPTLRQPNLRDKLSLPAWLRSRIEQFQNDETPSWLVSFVLHLVVILTLALIPMAKHIGLGDSLVFTSGDGGSESGSDELTSFVPETATEDLGAVESLSGIDSVADAITSEAMNFDLNAPKTSDATSQQGLSFELDSPILGGLKGRTGAMRDALFKAYGGTQGTEDAVALGLSWLARQQRNDGSWSLVGPFRGGATIENKPAATAMALLALVGAGNTHREGTYKTNVKKGIDFLIKIQDEDGFFAESANGTQRTYAQAQCSIVVCELYGMTTDPKLETVAMRAIKYAENAQGANGGWRYKPREAGDLSVTGWYVMALMSARMAGLYVESETLQKVHPFLDSVQRMGNELQQNSEGERYCYQSHPSRGTPAMTAEGMLCRLYLGWEASDKRIQAGCDYINSHLITSDPKRPKFYDWYYMTTMLHHVGGAPWRTWNDAMKTNLPDLQEKSGPNRGSWAATGDAHEGAGGRLYATCLSILCLETYYRHLPLNRMSNE